MSTTDNIMVLKDHSYFEYVHGSQFLGQSIDNMFVLRISMNLPRSGVDLVKHMHAGGDIENLWTMFDHVKRLKDWTILACLVYNCKYCKMLMIACYYL